jgi:hypothetical protein
LQRRLIFLTDAQLEKSHNTIATHYFLENIFWITSICLHQTVPFQLPKQVLKIALASDKRGLLFFTYIIRRYTTGIKKCSFFDIHTNYDIKLFTPVLI